jgi:pyruvate,orthophosphate dikinase
MNEVKLNLSRLEKELTGKKFGGTENPLLVSVRSGAAVSMPGMMDTVLNLG